MPASNQKSEVRGKLLKYAANILSRRPYFRHALKQKLLLYAEKNKYPCHSGPDPESSQNIHIIDQIITELAASGYLDDIYLAEAYVRRQLGKCYGPKIIELKLKQLGLDQATIKNALFSEATKEAQTEAIQKFLAKYSRQDLRKVIDKLYRRGFPSSLIHRTTSFPQGLSS